MHFLVMNLCSCDFIVTSSSIYNGRMFTVVLIYERLFYITNCQLVMHVNSRVAICVQMIYVITNTSCIIIYKFYVPAAYTVLHMYIYVYVRRS